MTKEKLRLKKLSQIAIRAKMMGSLISNEPILIDYSKLNISFKKKIDSIKNLN